MGGTHTRQARRMVAAAGARCGLEVPRGAEMGEAHVAPGFAAWCVARCPVRGSSACEWAPGVLSCLMPSQWPLNGLSGRAGDLPQGGWALRFRAAGRHPHTSPGLAGMGGRPPPCSSCENKPARAFGYMWWELVISCTPRVRFPTHKRSTAHQWPVRQRCPQEPASGQQPVDSQQPASSQQPAVTRRHRTAAARPEGARALRATAAHGCRLRSPGTSRSGRGGRGVAARRGRGGRGP